MIVAILAAFVVLAVLSLLSLRKDQVQLQEHNVPYAVAVAGAALDAKGMANDERGYLISANREFLEEFDQRLLNARTAFAEAAIAAKDDDEHAAVTKAQAEFEQWVWAAQQGFKIFQAGDRQKATKTALGPGRALRKEYEASLAVAQAAATEAIELRRNSFTTSGWPIILVGCLVLVVGFSLVVMLWMLRTLNSTAGLAELREPTPAAESVRDRRLRRRHG